MKKFALFTSLLLSACAPQEASLEPSAGSFRDGHTQRMMLSVPGVLVDGATRSHNKLDLANPDQVAKALGITLSGDPKQVLYVLQMTAPNSEKIVVRREIPIRVENVKQGAEMIRQWQEI